MGAIIYRHIECGRGAHTLAASKSKQPSSQHTRAGVHSVLFHSVDPHYCFPFHVGCGCCHDAADAGSDVVVVVELEGNIKVIKVHFNSALFASLKSKRQTNQHNL